tara:strand:- start:866 stop:1339 length:474 start_codon:yes stop_codon:yes gene_type:complete
MSVKTQGTELYYADPTESSPLVVKLACPTGISGLGGAKDQIDDTCLEATGDRSFVAGLGNPGQVSVPFILDPQAASHQDLFDLKEGGVVLNWMACLSDGTGTPTLDSNDDFEPVATRTCIGFRGYIADVNIDIAGNDVVRGTLTIQRSGSVTFTKKA